MKHVEEEEKSQLQVAHDWIRLETIPSIPCRPPFQRVVHTDELFELKGENGKKASYKR